MKKGKSWMTDMNQVQVHLPQQQVSVTIYGAIGSTLQAPLFMIGKCLQSRVLPPERSISS